MDPFSLKSTLRALAASKRQEPSSYQPQEEPRDPVQKLGSRIQKDIVKEAPPGLLERAGGTALSGLATVGNLLDVPGSMVRDVATWLPGGPAPANPLDQIASPFTHHNRTTGRDLMRGYGLAGKEDTMGNFTTGLGAEIALDPLTYLTFGASALTRGGRAAKALNLMDDAPEIASRLMNRRVGKREARHVVTPRMLLSNPKIGDEARQRLQQRMTEMGVTEKDLDRQLGGLAKINMPFSNKPFTWHKKPITFGGLTDEDGIIGAGRIRGRGPEPLSPLPDMDVPPPGDIGPAGGSAIGGDGPDIPPTRGPAPDITDMPDSPVTPEVPPLAGPAAGAPAIDPTPVVPSATINAISDIQQIDPNNFGVQASIPESKSRARATLTYASESDETPMLFIDQFEKQPGSPKGSGRALINSMVEKVKDRNPMGVAGNFDTHDQLGAFASIFGKDKIRFLDRATGQPVDISFAEVNKTPDTISKYTAVHYFIEPPKAAAKVEPEVPPQIVDPAVPSKVDVVDDADFLNPKSATAEPQVPPQAVAPEVPSKVEVVDDAKAIDGNAALKKAESDKLYNLLATKQMSYKQISKQLNEGTVIPSAETVMRRRLEEISGEIDEITRQLDTIESGRYSSKAQSKVEVVDDAGFLNQPTDIPPSALQPDLTTPEVVKEAKKGKGRPKKVEQPTAPITQPMTSMEAMQAEAGIKPATSPSDIARKTQALIEEVANKRGAGDAEVAEMLLRGDTASAIRRLETKPLDGLKLEGLMSAAKKNGIMTAEQADAVLAAIPPKFKGGMSVLDEAKQVSNDLASKSKLDSQGGTPGAVGQAPTKVDLNTLEGLPEQARPIVGDMISKIGQKLFDDVTMEVGGDAAKAVTTGDIDMDTGFIRIYNSAIQSGIVDKTTVHELWHHLSKFITAEEVRIVQKEFDDAVKANKGPLPYELSSIDEYFAHKLTDLSMKYLGKEKPASLIGKTWAKALDVFEYLWDAIRQTLGYDKTKQILNSFLDGHRAGAVKLTDATMQQRLAGDVEPENILRSEIDAPTPVISRTELEQMAAESGKFRQYFSRHLDYLKTSGYLTDNDVAFLYSAFKNAEHYNIGTDVKFDSSLEELGVAGKANAQKVYGVDKYGQDKWGMFEILLNKNVKHDRPRVLLHELGHMAYFTMDSAMRKFARDAMSAFAKTKEGQKYFTEVYGDKAFKNGTLQSDYFMSNSSEMFAQLFTDHLTRRSISNNSKLMGIIQKTWEKVADIVARVVGYDRSARTSKIVSELMDYAAGFKQEDEFLKAIGDLEKSLSSNASESSRKAAEIFFGSETHKTLLKQGYSLSTAWGGSGLSSSKLMMQLRKMLKDSPTSERKALATLIENNDTPFVKEIELGNDIEVKDIHYMPLAESSAKNPGNVLESQADPVIPNSDIAGQLAQAKSAILGKSLDDIGESILDSAVGRQMTALFDQSVLGQITKAGQEAARLAFKGYRDAVFKERAYMAQHLRTWYDLPNIREDIIMDEELAPLAEYITNAGGDKALGAKNRMIEARKIQNDRVNGLRRLLEQPLWDEQGNWIQDAYRVEESELPAWVGQEKANGQIINNPTRRQQVAEMLTAWRLKTVQMLGGERNEGILLSLVNGYFPRLVSNLPGSNRSLWNPNYGKILDPTHPSAKRRKDWFVGYDDGTSVINDISIDAELSGAHSKKMVREQPSPAEIQQYANVLWERYKDRLMGGRAQLTYGELAQADPKAFAKINKLTEEVMNLDPRHVEHQIPLFSNDLFSAMELRLEHHHRSIMHAKAIQHLVKKHAVARNLIGGDGQGVTLNQLLKESKYDSNVSRDILEVGTRGDAALAADKSFWNQEIQPRINEVMRHYQAERAYYLRNPDAQPGVATGVTPYTDPGGRAFQVLPYQGDGVRRFIFPQFFDKKVPGVPSHQMKLEVNLDDPSETMVTWFDQLDDGQNFIGESLAKILDNPTDKTSGAGYVSGTPTYVLFEHITVPKDVGDAITKFVQGPRTLEEVRPLVRGYDKGTNMWKMMQTGMLPFIGFHGRNFGSGQASNFYLGVQNDPRFKFNLANPTTYLNPIRSFVQPIVDAHKIATGQTIEGAASMPQFAGMNLTDEAATEALRRESYAQAITGEKQGISAEQLTDTVGTAASQFPGIDASKSINPLAWQWSKPVPESTFAQRWLMPWMSKGVMSDADIFRPGQLGRDLGSYTESLNRLAPYIAMRRQGFDPKAAAREVNRAQVDYTNLSNFNREYTRRLFPFASYTLGMTPTVFGELASRPGGGMGRTVMATTAAGQSSEQGVTPDYIRETASIPLGMSEDGTRSYITGFGLPFEDPLQFAQLARGNVSGVLRELGSRMNPVPKSLIEIMTGRSLYQAGPFGGREIEDLDPTIGRIVANINDLATGEKTEKAEPFLGNPWAEYIIANAGPGRMLNTVRTITDPRKWDTVPWKLALNLGTGVRVADVSPSAQDAILRERLARVMKDFGGRMYTRPYFPDYAKEDWTPQEAEDAAKIDALLKLLGQRAKERRVP